MQTKYLEIVNRLVREQRGVIDFFQGDHVVVTFNAVTNASAPGKRAAVAMHNVAHAIREDHQLPAVAVGFSTGEAMVGNMGTSDMTRFNIVGSVYPRAVALQRAATEQLKAAAKANPEDAPHLRILTTREATIEFEHEMYWQAIDVMMNLPSRVSEKRGIIVAAVEGFKKFKSDEWMYEIEEGDNSNPFILINEAYLLFSKKNYAAAKEVAVALHPNLLGVNRLNELLATAV